MQSSNVTEGDRNHSLIDLQALRQRRKESKKDSERRGKARQKKKVVEG